MPKCLIFHMFKHEEFFSAILKQPQATNSVLLRDVNCLNLAAVFFKTSNLVYIYIYMLDIHLTNISTGSIYMPPHTTLAKANR